MKEEWRFIVDFPGYDVSDLGRVRSYWLLGRSKGMSSEPQRIRPLQLNKYGYWIITLRKDEKYFTRSVHVLVATSFLGPRPKDMEICHGAAGIKDNSVSNLSYGPRSKNMGEDRVRDGTSNRGEQQGSHKLTKDQAAQIYELAMKGDMTQSEIGAMFDIAQATVSKIKLGYRWSYDSPSPY